MSQKEIAVMFVEPTYLKIFTSQENHLNFSLSGNV